MDLFGLSFPCGMQQRCLPRLQFGIFLDCFRAAALPFPRSNISMGDAGALLHNTNSTQRIDKDKRGTLKDVVRLYSYEQGNGVKSGNLMKIRIAITSRHSCCRAAFEEGRTGNQACDSNLSQVSHTESHPSVSAGPAEKQMGVKQPFTTIPVGSTHQSGKFFLTNLQEDQKLSICYKEGRIAETKLHILRLTQLARCSN